MNSRLKINLVKTIWLRHTLRLCLGLWTIQGYCQTQEPNPDRLYEDFSQAYHDMNAELINQLYTQDAVLLNLYDASHPSSIHGNEEIANFFSEMFNRIEKNGEKLELTFKIIDRKKIKDTILDNGFYILTVHGPDRAKRTSYGKLSTILKLGEKGWKFTVDANSNTDESEYRNAEGTEISRSE